MQRVRLIIVTAGVCLAVFAGVVPALAGTGGNPQWSVAGAQLVTGETKGVTGEAATTQKLKSGESTVACSTVALESGSVIAGGSGATPGTGTEQLLYGSCVVQNTTSGEVAVGCKVNSVGQTAGSVKTEQLKAKLAYTTGGAAELEEPNTVTVLKPETGTVFLQLEMSGEHCPTPGNGKYNVEGEIALKNPEGSSEKTKHTAEAPTTSVKTYYLNSGGLPKEEKVKGLKVGGVTTAVYTGNTTSQTSGESLWAVIK
jgi:hypothetical protein